MGQKMSRLEIRKGKEKTAEIKLLFDQWLSLDGCEFAEYNLQ